LIRRAHRSEKGISILEFALVGIAVMLLMVSLVQMSLAMWNYHTLAYAVREAARYASTKGRGCTYSGNSCSVKVSDVAQRVAASGFGLAPAQLSVTLTSVAGNVTCNPVSNCYSNSTVWPPSSANKAGQTIAVAAYYPARIVFLPISGTLQIAALTLRASSQQLILF
jgi:Flp pilus assembly protein TadG